MTTRLTVKTSTATEMIDISAQVQRALTESGRNEGVVVLYVLHTTAAITVNEGADPSVRTDIIDTLNEIVPWKRAYRHAEGNSPAHIKATMVGSSEMVPFENGRLQLGRWQSIYFCEFDGPRTRTVLVKILE
ncbi:MAG: YjbQ family protein [Deltaproteobacteria bacterium]|nr:YjbQ family protein [Deltaproteobacteria bacterium]